MDFYTKLFKKTAPQQKRKENDEENPIQKLQEQQQGQKGNEQKVPP